MTATITVFDIGNVLVRWDPRQLVCKLFDDDQEMETFLAAVLPDIAAADNGTPYEETIADIKARYPHWADQIDAYERRWEETFTPAIDGSVAILSELKAAGKPFYALSNFTRDQFALGCMMYPFLNDFTGRVMSFDVGACKPDPAMYRTLFDRFDLAPAQLIFFDDRPENVEAAQAEGMQAHLFTNPDGMRAKLVSAGVLPKDKPTLMTDSECTSANEPDGP
ncbi:MAG: HAD family phosphatase [Pseudomonadota bacterium]|nr:HAD family phosphatase [Pseudomonadota bacterium]